MFQLGKAHQDRSYTSFHQQDSSDQDETSTDTATSAVGQNLEPELARLVAELRAMTHEVQEKEHELEHLCQFWVQRKEPLEANIASLSDETASIKEEMQGLQFKLTYGRFPPTGPEWLRFVDGTKFSVFVSAVILANLVTMTAAILDPSQEALVFKIDYGYLFIYTVELLLRVGYYQRHFLYGHLKVVGWHWVDTFLVVDGFLFLGVYTFEGGSEAAKRLQFFRVFRVLRYLRFLKLLNQATKSISSSVETDRFTAFMLIVIATNSIVMGLEVEYPQLGFIWFWTENAFLLIFVFEITLMFSEHGCRGFFTECDGFVWRMLDLVIVVCGMLDQWFLPLFVIIGGYLGVHGVSSLALVHSIQMFRIFRLFRLLRLLKLIRNIRPLYTLILGILTAMQGISWVIFLTVIVLYTSALVGVKLVGPRGMLVPSQPPPEADEVMQAAAATIANFTYAAERMLHGRGRGSSAAEHDGPDVASCFPNIFDASFNLFKVMQMDLEPMVPLFEWAPLSKYLIMMYVILTNWAIFSILTAVVSDEMARVTNDFEKEQQRAESIKQNRKVVAKIFDSLDTNHSGEISEHDYKQLLADPAAMSEICEAIAFTETDLEDLFFILCHEKADGQELLISREDFLDELEKERAVVHNRSVLKLEKRIEHVARRLDHGIRRLEELYRSSEASSPG